MSFFARDLYNMHRQMNSLFDAMHSTYGINDGMDIDDIMMPAFMPLIDNANDQQALPAKDASALTNTSSDQSNNKQTNNKQLTQARNNNNSLSLFPSSFGSLGQSMLSMSVDIHAEADKYLVSCELPGVDKSCIDISADKRTNTLSIKAVKRHEFTQTAPSHDNNKSNVSDKVADAATPSANGDAKSDANKANATNDNNNNKSSPRVIRQERAYGMVQRSFRLSKDADLDNIQAKFDNGVLKLDVPRVKKAENEVTKKITIQ